MRIRNETRAHYSKGLCWALMLRLNSVRFISTRLRLSEYIRGYHDDPVLAVHSKDGRALNGPSGYKLLC